LIPRKKAKKSLFSFEILPPLKGKGIESLYHILDPLMEIKPAFVNVTYHRYDFIYRETSPGVFHKVYLRKRPGTVGICAALKFKYKVDAVPHLICGGFNKDQTEDALIDLYYLGVDNVLALRGDAPHSEKIFKPEIGGHEYAEGLVKQIVNMNNGKYLSRDLDNAFRTNFSIAVAGYPEKHFEAPNFDVGLKYLKQKVDAGAEYIVTQMFFDNQKFFDFVDKCRAIGITVPIVPGIKPLSRKSQGVNIPRSFHCDIPDALFQELQKCDTKEAAEQVGTEWCIMQSKELLKNNVPSLHFYTMGKSKQMLKIAEAIF